MDLVTLNYSDFNSAVPNYSSHSHYWACYVDNPNLTCVAFFLIPSCFHKNCLSTDSSVKDKGETERARDEGN